MRKLVIFIGIFASLLVLSGCKEEEVIQENGVKIYYIGESGTKLETQDYVLSESGRNARLTELLDCLKRPSDKIGCKAPLSYDFTVDKAEIHKQTAYLDMSQNYSELPVITEVLVRAAIVKTLTQIDGVDYVYFTVGKRQMYDCAGEHVGRMDAEQFIYNDGNEINTYELTKVKLYFANSTSDKLIPAYREKRYSTNISLERFVVEELINGTSGLVSGLYATVNPETKIISVSTRDGICYVNLNQAFLSVENNVPTELAVYSVVNSLVELPNINKVQILIDGEVPTTFEAPVYERNLDCVTTLQQ